MLRVYDSLHNAIAPLLNYEGLCVTEEVNGETQIEFSMPKSELHRIKEEYYIRTPENEFIIKEISISSEDLVKVVAKINVEELKGTPVKYFETIAKNPFSCISLALSYCPGGWTVESDIDKRRTLRQSQKSVWDIIKSALDLYIAEMEIDAIHKVIKFKNKIGEDKGTYFMEGLNLSKVDISSDTYDLVTRIYPVGADGLTIADVNDGVLYVENHEYSNKILAAYWEDNRYTIAENLRDDAIERLETLAKPTRSYDCSVIDLATAAGLSVFDYHIGDTVWLKSEFANEKHRIVSMKSYPNEPEKNTCTLSTNLSSLVTYMEDNLTATEAVQLVVTQDGRIDPSKVDVSGAGVPSGGTTGQALTKASDEDGDVIWKTIQSGAGVSIEEIEAMIKIKSEDIQDAAITNAKIAQAAITEANIAHGAIATAHIQDGAIDNAKIGVAAIKSANIDVAAINSTHIQDAAITDAKIQDAAITTAKIGEGQITTALIADAAIDNAKIKDLSVDNAKIKNAAITTEKVADATITNAKIANLAVDSAKLADASITTAKIADASITSAKIISLDAGLITSGTIATERLILYGQTGSIVFEINEANGTPELSKQTIDGGSITKRTISADNIMAGTITTAELAAECITADKIAAGAITADKLQANSITLGQMAPETVDGIIKEGKDYTDAVVSYYGEFLNFSVDKGLVIGSNQTDFKSQFTSDEIGFYNGDNKMAWIDNTGFYFDSGRCETQFMIGKWLFNPQSDDSLSLIWRG